jgi:hypothetical protein
MLVILKNSENRPPFRYLFPSFNRHPQLGRGKRYRNGGRFSEFFKITNISNPRIKILPGFLLGQLAKNTRNYFDDEHVTEKCFENFDIKNLQCSTSRMATKTGVYVCPILVDNDNARMGDTIGETLRPFPLAHSACYTCRITGMTCKTE